LRPEVPLLLVGEESAFGGSQSWSFFHDDLAEDEFRLAAPLIAHSWPGYYVAFPDGSRKLRADCSIIRPAQLDKAVRETLGADHYRLKARIVAVRDDNVILHGGEKIFAEGVIDARAATNLNLLDLGWRIATGREYVVPAPHRVDRPVLIDATLSPDGGCRFTSCLPFSEQSLFVEDVYYSLGLDGEDPEAAGARLDAYVARRGWKGGKHKHGQVTASPVALGGDFPAYWRFGGARVAKIGFRGGFFHPTTGSALADAARTPLLLTQQRDNGGVALHDMLEAYATSLWSKRDFYRSFNAALFEGRAGVPCGTLDRLYGLDPALIARFHAERLGLLDRRRVVNGIGR
jgi:lycopene beta-cyclase